MKRNNIIILVGNIGSGKSTLARKYQEQNYIVISKDNLRYSIGGGNYIFYPMFEPIIWKTELYLLRSFLKLGVNIVIDGVALSKKLRKRYIIETKKYNYKIICHELPKLTMKKSIDRRMKSNHGTTLKEVWREVWRGFDNIYETPSLKEGFDKIINEK